MSEPNPYSPPRAPVELEPEQPPEATLPREGPKGLAGWLVIVAIGLIISPIRVIFYCVQTYVPMVRDGTIQALMTPGSESFHLPLAALLIFEALANAVSVSFGIWLVVLFFQKSRRFPVRYVILAAFSVTVILGDAYAIASLGLGSPWDADTIREMIRSIIGLLVWGPYMFLSKRVENTFVRR
jgi:hypothetical protein